MSWQIDEESLRMLEARLRPQRAIPLIREMATLLEMNIQTTFTLYSRLPKLWRTRQKPQDVCHYLGRARVF